MAIGKGVNIVISADADSAIETFGKVKVKLTDFQKGMNSATKEMGAFGSVAVKGLTVPIVASTTALTLATKEASNFQKGMLEIKTLLPKLSTEGFEQGLNIFNPIVTQTTNIFSEMQENMANANQAELDRLDNLKNVTLENNDIIVESELDKYKKTMTARRKDYNEDIKEKKNRMKVALGLYEQERLEKELSDLETKDNELTEEEDKELKRLEIEEDFAKQRFELEFNAAMQNWEMQKVKGIASLAQAILGAVNSGMNSGPPPLPFIMTPILVGMAATMGGIQLGTLQGAKPQRPQLAEGGIIRRRIGGLDAIIGEGRHNEAVIPLSDDVLSKIGSQMHDATPNTETEKIVEEIFINQPLVLQVSGKTIIDVVLEASKRGIKVVSSKGIMK